MRGGTRGEVDGRCLVVLLVLFASSAEALEVRVRSDAGGGPTHLVIDVGAGATAVIDRTPQATAPSAGRLAAGRTFADEITLELPALALDRPVTVDVSDDLVSAVRAHPAERGGRLVVFVRRPVTYEVQPTPDGRGLAVTLTAAALVRPPARHGKPIRARGERGGDRVAIDAESVAYDRTSDTVTASGGVTITRGDTTLRADEVRYARTAEIARASGRVSLIDREMTVRGAAAEVDLGREVGWVEDAEADLPDNRYRVEARRLEKCGPVSYRAEDGVFTTCRCGGIEKPTWSVSGAEAEVTLGGFGTAREARFHLLDVPILYLPRLVFPASTERQSGFLLPRVGYSNRNGFIYQQPFFWAIGKSSDATLVADIETAARVGGALEYRYLHSKEARGAFTGLLYNEQIGGNLDRTEAQNIQVGSRDVPENRYAGFGRFVQPFVGGSTWYGDLSYVSDDLFLREVNIPTGVDVGWHPRNTRFTRSDTGVIETWNGGLVQLQTTYFQDLVDPQHLTLQELPRITAEHAVPLLGGHVVARLWGDTTLFQRETGFDGWRTQVAPEVYVPFQLGRYAFGSVRGLVREQLYYLTDTEQVGLAIPDNENILPRFRQLPSDQVFFRPPKIDGKLQPTLAAPLDRTHAEDSAEVSARLGTQFARVYDFPHWGFARLRHTIEPEVRFTYIPDSTLTLEKFRLRDECGPNGRKGIDCKGRVFTEPYLFDQDDAINRRSFLAYGLTTRLFGRPAAPAEPPPEVDETTAAPAPAAPTPPRELARFSILHGYDITRTLVGDSHSSDVDLALRVTPVRYAGLGYSATVSFQSPELIGQSVGVFVREPWEPPPGLQNLQQPSMLVAAYRFVTENASRGLAPNSAEEALFQNDGVEELSAGVYLRLNNHLGASYLTRYDFTHSVVPGRETIGPHFLEQAFLVRVLSRCNCWMLDVGVRHQFDTGSTTGVVQFTLVGLGGGGTGGASGLLHGGFGAIPGLPSTPRLGNERRTW